MSKRKPKVVRTGRPSAVDGKTHQEKVIDTSELPELPHKKEISQLVEKYIPEAEIPHFMDLIGVSITSVQSFSGPVPPPQILGMYNNVAKNGAERILAMAENQSTHRMQLEDHVIKGELKQSGRGQIFGFILGLAGMGAAVLLGFNDHEVLGGVIGGSTLVAIVSVFVLGRHQQKDGHKEK